MNQQHYFTTLEAFVSCITKAVNLVQPEMTNHHQQVAYLSFRIAEQMHLSAAESHTLVLASLLHDVGAIANNDQDPFHLPEDENVHAFLGARLFEDFARFQNIVPVIKYHHWTWNYGEGRSYKGEAIPELAHVLHLADAIAKRIRPDEFVISQISPTRKWLLEYRDRWFMPAAVDAFMGIANQEALWLDLSYDPSINYIMDDLSLDAVKLTLDETVQLTDIVSRIIDFRSPFTAMHSSGVAATAVELAQLSGFSEDECKMMHIAGNLHDLGKLAIPTEILEKNNNLEPKEYDIIRSHSYYSYKLLYELPGFETIAKWAAYHHEKLNGKGYPFHLKGAQLSLGSRIMAVADIFAAITEDRPYRPGMPQERAVGVIESMIRNDSISGDIGQLLIHNYERISQARKDASQQAVERYQYLFDLPDLPQHVTP
ncbi:HD domain-containing protein [Oscillospiraceae bacterium HV4-5-C5C]|nr:HD domain-containing protein [Oscillospiraceae bacterium HV4-5-C5C]